nr:reverse transcriptase domain-containing protein [Tanacetum cinerariifolium]
MLTRVMNQSVGLPVAESREGGTGGRVGKGGRRGRGTRGGNDERVDELNGQGNNQGLRANEGIRMLSREFSVRMLWNNFKFMMIEEFYPSHEMQKLETKLRNHAIDRVGHAAYTDRFHKLARLVPHLVTLKIRKIERYVYSLALQIRRMVAAMKPQTIQKAVLIFVALTNEAIRNGSIKKVKKRGNVKETSRDKNGKDDNKRTRTGNAFATTAKPVGRENTSYLAKDCRGMPRNVNPVNARNPTIRACYEYGSTDHDRLACPRLNRAQGPEGNCPNQVAANNEV